MSRGVGVDWAVYDLPADAYPFTMEFLTGDHLDPGEVVASITVSGPGALAVPPLRQEFGPVTVRCTFANGTVSWAGP